MSSYLGGGVVTLDRWEGLKEWHRRHQDLLQGKIAPSLPRNFVKGNFGADFLPESSSLPPQVGNESQDKAAPATAKHDLSIIQETDEDSRSKDGDFESVRIDKQKTLKIVENKPVEIQPNAESSLTLPASADNDSCLKRNMKEITEGKQMTKRPFLRKGKGLIRYNLQLEETKHPYQKKPIVKSVQKHSTHFVKNSSVKSASSMSSRKNLEWNSGKSTGTLQSNALTAPMQRLVLTIPPQKQPSQEASTWSQVLGGDIELSFKPNPDIRDVSSKPMRKQETPHISTHEKEQPKLKSVFSPSRKMNSLKKSDSLHEEDQESLAAYLDLEQHVENASFCSTSSKVDRLVAKSSNSFHLSNPDAITQAKPLSPVKTGRKLLSCAKVKNGVSEEHINMLSSMELENLVKARARRSGALVKTSKDARREDSNEFLHPRNITMKSQEGNTTPKETDQEIATSLSEPSQESQDIEWMLEDLGLQRKPHLMKTMPGIDLDSSLIKNALEPCGEQYQSDFDSDSSLSDSSSSEDEIEKCSNIQIRNCSLPSQSSRLKEALPSTEKCDTLISAPLKCATDITFEEMNNQIESHLSDLKKEIETLQSAKGKSQKYMVGLEKKVQELEHRLILDARSFNKRLEDERVAAAKRLSEEQAKFLKEKQVLQRTLREERKKAPDPVTQQELLQLKQEVAQWEEKWRSDRAKARGLESNLRIQITNFKRENEKLKEENSRLRREKETAVSTAKAKASSNTRIINSIAQNLTNVKPKLSIVRDRKQTSKSNAKDCTTVNSAYGLKATDSKAMTTIENFPKFPNAFNEWSSDEEIDLGKETSDEDVDDRTNVKNTVHNAQEVKQRSCVFEQEPFDLEEAQAKYDAIFGKNCTDSHLKASIDDNVVKPSSSEENHPSQRPTSPKCAQSDPPNTEEYLKSIHHPDGKIEQVKENGTRVITYPDGTWKRHSSSGSIMTVPPSGWPIHISYFNGDQLEKLSDGTTRYFYAKTNIWQTTFPDGHEELKYPSGQVEHRKQDGTVHVLLPKSNEPSCDETQASVDNHISNGISVEKRPNGDTVILLPNGERELHTKDFMKKEFLDGTVKFLYNDGSQETLYPSGRIRVKDGQGNLVKDTFQG